MSDRVDYRERLRERAAAAGHLDRPKALTSMELRNRESMARWRARWAEHHRRRE